MTQGENMDLKHFVTYYSLGDIQNNEQTLEVKSNDLVSLNIPNGTFGFKTFDRATDDIYKDGDKIVEKNEVLNEKTFYTLFFILLHWSQDNPIFVAISFLNLWL